MIAFKDFVPQQTQRQGFIKPAAFEVIEDVVAALNEWLRDHEVAVINVETVVVPGLRAKNEPKSSRANFSYGGYTSYSGEWSQFIRVWYTAK